MSPEIITSLKLFNWQKIIDYGNSLTDLNDAQLRFLKGLAIEQAVEVFGDGDIKYVGEKHRDYQWPKYEIDLELKTIFSQGMYNVKGDIKTLPGIRLNNSMGTNKAALDPATIADVLVVVLRDGAYAVSKEIVLANAKHLGDGWELKLTKSNIVELSGRILTKHKYNTNISRAVKNAIKESLSGL
jgi:hypothetical protein